MMATESPRGRSDEATLTSDPEPTISIDSDSHNAEPDPPHVNGDDASRAATDEFENKHISDIVDDLVNSTEVSVSGGSDNEATKGDVSKLKDGEKGHGRTSSSSIKKSFKSISVNKTFQPTKISAPSVTAKPTDKAAPAAGTAPAQIGNLSATRPRLVVKSGSGSVAKSSLGANGGKAGSAPDASAVWNKNRPQPPPEPKKYTDEELKKYGIHMASRLQTDDTKGQANWADIDDDDDEWVPDTITWQDGTKIALPHVEEHQPPAPAPAPAAEPAPAPAPAPTLALEPVSAPAPRLAPKENGLLERPKVAPTPSPIIKPGVLGSGKGLILKGATEKPTLVAKPPAPPTPVKSPWAPIPRVDKISPIAVDTTAHAGSRLPPISKSNTPPPREIAADDFNRSHWRGDGSAGAGSQLYNSQSGRLEPAPDRRGSFRTEAHSGRPAVLQRSSHHDQQAHADPSGALQPGRPNDQTSPYGRRRGSSNVSGGSGGYMRRLGHDAPLPPAELLNARRGSMTGRSDSPASPRTYSPSGLHGGPRQQWPVRASPSMSQAVPYHQSAQPSDVPPQVQTAQPTIDILEEQKKLMRERRELAMKRRLEEEAKEEAERKERIRLKLEALGPAPEPKSSKKTATKDQVITPTQIQPREVSPPQPKAVEPAVPDSTASESSKTDTLVNGIQPHAQPSTSTVETTEQTQASSHAHPWPPKTERYPAPVTTWGTQPTAVAKNVWGAPSATNRSLGNGTFAADIGPAQVPSLSGKPGPGPIAPPPIGTRAAQSTTAAAATGRQPPIGPPRQAGRNAQGTDLDSQERSLRQQAWSSSVRLNDDAFNQMLNSQVEERDRKLQKEGRTLADLQPVIKDTWRPTKIDESGHRADAAPKQSLHLAPERTWPTAPDSKALSSKQAPSVGSAAPSDYSQRTQSTAPIRDTASASILGANAAAPQPTRGSRFFPAHRDRQDTAAEAAQRPKSPSPPPPDMAGHPAYDGDTAHPHVSLPRPQPVVRLPPPVTSTERRAAAPDATGAVKPPGPNFAWASQAAYKENEDIVPTGPSSAQQPRGSGGSWQAKINSLLGKGPVAQKSPVFEPARESAPHHQPHHPIVFPRPIGAASGKDGSIITKVQDEECFEEQEMGSLPPVRLPSAVPDAAWEPSPPPKPLPRRLHPIPSSAEALTFSHDTSSGSPMARISIPGNPKAVFVPLAGRTRSNPRGRAAGQRAGRQPPTAPHTRGGRGRDGSSYLNEQGSGASGSNAGSNRGSRGGYQQSSRSERWTRPATVQT